jgi:hypothetical protein
MEEAEVMTEAKHTPGMWDTSNEWLREQIAFAIFNDTNPLHVRDSITLQNIGGDPELRSSLGDGWTATSNLGMDWRLNRDSFLKLANVALRAMAAADEDGSAYAAAPEPPAPDDEDRHPMALRHRSGAMGMQAGDRVRSKIDGRTGVADEFTHDGDTYMTWDDGTHGMYNWSNLEPAPDAAVLMDAYRECAEALKELLPAATQIFGAPGGTSRYETAKERSRSALSRLAKAQEGKDV